MVKELCKRMIEGRKVNDRVMAVVLLLEDVLRGTCGLERDMHSVDDLVDMLVGIFMNLMVFMEDMVLVRGI